MGPGSSGGMLGDIGVTIDFGGVSVVVNDFGGIDLSDLDLSGLGGFGG